MVWDQVRDWDANMGRVQGGSARLGRGDGDRVGCGSRGRSRERVNVCRDGALVSSLLLRSALSENGIGSFVRRHGLPCLDFSFFLVHAELFLGVEGVVVVDALLFLLLLEEFELLGCRVHVVDVGDVAVEVAVVVSWISGLGTPIVVDLQVLECSDASLAALELFLY